MTPRRLPTGLVPSGGSLNFSETTLPDAFEFEHRLAEARWGVLHVFEGSVRYVELDSGEDIEIIAPDLIVIAPQVAHRLDVVGPMLCRVDFFREPTDGSAMRTPGSYADDAVRLSLDRCESNGEFGAVFYEVFLNAAQEIPHHFENTEFNRQRTVLTDSVRMMVEHDVSEPEMRQMLEQLGESHSRSQRNIPPRLYELWLDSVCGAVELLDPEWDAELERLWRVRLRPGMQIIMAAY